MRRRGTFKSDEPQPKKIHVAWPTLCSVELEQCCTVLEVLLARLRYRGKEDDLVVVLTSAISAVKKAQEALDRAYGE